MRPQISKGHVLLNLGMFTYPQSEQVSQSFWETLSASLSGEIIVVDDTEEE